LKKRFEGCVSPYNPGVETRRRRRSHQRLHGGWSEGKRLEHALREEQEAQGSNYYVVADVFFHLVVAAWYVIGIIPCGTRKTTTTDM
jgi:hypothetical protein